MVLSPGDNAQLAQCVTGAVDDHVRPGVAALVPGVPLESTGPEASG